MRRMPFMHRVASQIDGGMLASVRGRCPFTFLHTETAEPIRVSARARLFRYGYVSIPHTGSFGVGSHGIGGGLFRPFRPFNTYFRV